MVKNILLSRKALVVLPFVAAFFLVYTIRRQENKTSTNEIIQTHLPGDILLTKWKSLISQTSVHVYEMYTATQLTDFCTAPTSSSTPNSKQSLKEVDGNAAKPHPLVKAGLIYQDLVDVLFVPSADKCEKKAHPLSDYSRYKSTPDDDKHIIPSVKTSTGPIKVLITTYMRSGSSFVGKVLGWRTDTFYLYEPLWVKYTWTYLRDESSICSLYQPTCNKEDELSSHALKYLQDVYSCNISQHHKDIDIQQHTSDYYGGPSWIEFRKCMNGTSAQNKKIACLQKETLFCNTTSNRVAKVLRLSLKSARPLLSSIPDLKIIHLLRDPRGVMNSRTGTAGFYKARLGTSEKIDNDIKVLCSRMQSDINEGKQLMKDFPDRVKLIQYEDFQDPVDRAEQLYRFLGMKFTHDSVKQFVGKINNSNSNKPVKNFHPFSYRKTFPWKYAKMVNTHCSTVYKELGLVEFNNETELKNENVSAIQSVLPFALA